MKVILYITKGLIGIATNHNLSIKTKILLYIDYIRLIIHVIAQSNTQKQKEFYFLSFGYKISYESKQSFFFTVNEVFCAKEYKVYTHLKNYIDLGSNIGIAVLWYRFFNPKLAIYCFEPDINNFRYLQKNMKQNHIRRCHLFNSAVHNKNGTAKFFRIIDNIQNLDSGLKRNLDLPYEVEIVKTEKVSSLIKKMKHVSLIKMDIEGGEKAVFQDLFSTKAIRHIDSIIFENHFFTKKDRQVFTSNVKRLNSIGIVRTVSNTKLSSISIWERKKS